MSSRRSTVYLRPELHRALWLKAAVADRSMSDLINDAVRASLSEDADDLAAFRERKRDKSVNFEQVVASLRRRGKL